MTEATEDRMGFPDEAAFGSARDVLTEVLRAARALPGSVDGAMATPLMAYLDDSFDAAAWMGGPH